jgi:enoyl-CoA hydratase
MTDTYALLKDGVTAILTLQRPYCLDSTGKHELAKAFEQLAEAQDLRAVILTGSHPQAWLVNVAELAEMTPADARLFSQSGQRLAETIASLPIPVIAAVDGPALGGGCELVLACDIAIASESARFGQIEAMGGVIPAFGGTWRLARRVGHQRALEMIFTAEVIDAATAKAIGLVLDVAPSASLLSRGREMAARIAQVSRQSVSSAKRVIHAGTALPPAAIGELEQHVFATLFGTEDQRGRMRAYLANQPKEAKKNV